jgi:hypothetical protein
LLKVVGGTAGTVVGTILIPVPILGPTIGGVVGSVGGKLVGGVAGIALSKILEVHEKAKASKIKKMSTVPQLMINISPDSHIVRGLMGLTMDPEEEERIANVVEEAINGNAPKNSLYPSLDEFLPENSNVNTEKYEKAKELTTEVFPDNNFVEYFILTPIPDENAHQEFASSTDLLVLRWPTETIKPWESSGEKVLDINDLNMNKE